MLDRTIKWAKLMSEKGSRRRLYDSSDLNLKILYNRIQRGSVMVTHRTLTPTLWVRIPSSLPICPSGGIGRHTALKRLCCKACGFESRFGYQYGCLCRPIVSRVRTKQSGKNHKTAWFEVEMLLCHYRQRYRSMHSEFLPIGRAYWTSGGRNGQPSPLMEM